MHTLHRLRFILVLMLALVPMSAPLLVASVSRENAQEAFQHTLDEATADYRLRTGLGSLHASSEKQLTDAKAKLITVGKQKRQLRLQLSALLKLAASKDAISPLLLQNVEQTIILQAQQRDRLSSLVRYAGLQRIQRSTGPVVGRILFARLFSQSLGQTVSDDLRSVALGKAQDRLLLAMAESEETERLSVLRLQAAAGDAAEQIPVMQAQLNDLRAQYLTAERTADRAERTIENSAIDLTEIQSSIPEIHDQVLKLQAELARIDAQIRSRAERSLIEMGLRAPHPGEHSDGTVAGTKQFDWPVHGPISAGFHDPRYLQFFHVQHQGVDIVVPQGTPIRSAADGVVFVVKDNGDTSYTYVLIGHRDGYATLYGHLSAVSVGAGQDVSQGQVIGLSGGAPGSVGAGSMTTASHLHFEVIQSAENIDPKSVLP